MTALDMDTGEHSVLGPVLTSGRLADVVSGPLYGVTRDEAWPRLTGSDEGSAGSGLAVMLAASRYVLEDPSRPQLQFPELPGVSAQALRELDPPPAMVFAPRGTVGLAESAPLLSAGRVDERRPLVAQGLSATDVMYRGLVTLCVLVPFLALRSPKLSAWLVPCVLLLVGMTECVATAERKARLPLRTAVGLVVAGIGGLAVGVVGALTGPI